MRKTLLVCMLTMFVVGCTWDDAKNNVDTVRDVTEAAEGYLPPVAFPYAKLVNTGLLATSLVLGGIAEFLRRRKNKIKGVAILAADAVPGGGKALVEASKAAGVADEVAKEYRSKLGAGEVEAPTK